MKKIMLWFSLMLSASLFGAQIEYEIFAEVESVRQPDGVTLSFETAPESGKYYILERKTAVGEVEIFSVIEINDRGKVRCRAVAKYILNTDADFLLKAGMSIALVKKSEPFDRDFSNEYFEEKLVYKNKIVTQPDGRPMALIPEGKFILGSNDYAKEEGPQQTKYLGAYYIDVYEVSNSDYKKFADSPNGSAPISWKNGKYNAAEADLPVLVTFREAQAYCKWAGKRLPTEEEWEKAARGATARDYPWGERFESRRANGLPFWPGAEIKRGFNEDATGKKPVMLSVKSLAGEGASPYGIANMCGNAQEWTSSWFTPYKGNKSVDGRYGTQYKVIRGGACFSTAEELRLTRRETGGIPNLAKDNVAGFRCVKEPSPFDRADK